MSLCPVCKTETSTKFQDTPYRTCGACDLWFQDPLPPKRYQADNELDESGDAIGHLMSDRDKELNRGLAEHIVGRAGVGKTLDIGSKFPFLAHCFKNLGCDAYGMDNIKEVPSYSQSLGVPMLMADFEQISEEQIQEWTHTEKFHIITMIHVFEHMYNPIEALKKLRRLVADDGVVHLRFPDHQVSGFEQHVSPNHFAIHPYFWSLPAFLEMLVQVKDQFVVSVSSPMEGGGQRDVVLRPITKKPEMWCGMIVKNEERDLPKCLNTINGVVDGLVLIDTGSVDQTIEVAKQTFTGPLHVETYTGASKQDESGDWKLWDFSKARNVFVDRIDAIPSATHLLWMDADDTLLTPVNLRRAPYLDEFIVFGLMVESGGVRWVHHRMWKTRRGINFAGKIHEYPNFGGHHGVTLADNVIHHDAEPGGIGENSNERNLRILQGEFEENPTTRSAFYLANTHKDAGRWEEAVKYYDIRIGMGEGYRDEWLFAYLYKGRCERAFGRNTQAERTLLEALSHGPNWSEFWMELAFMAYSNAEWTKAMGYALEASVRPQEPTQLWRESNMYTDQPLRLLSFCAEQSGDKEGAYEWALKAKAAIGGPDPDWEARIRGLTPNESARLAEAVMKRNQKIVRPKIALHRPGAIGDIIMTLQLVPMLKLANPGREIHFYCHPNIVEELAEFMRSAGVDEAVDHNLLSQRAYEYEKVINLIGYPLADGYPEKPMAKHLLEYFGAEMGLTDINPGYLPKLSLPRPPKLPGLPKKYATLHAQAGWSVYKNWAFSRWAKVMEMCPDIPVIQIGSATDTKIPGADHRFMGRPLSDSINLIANATMHMGVDSFTNHLTHVKWKNKGQTPAVILWGSTQHEAAGYPHNHNISLGLGCQPCFREDPRISRQPRGVCINPPEQTYEQPRHACMTGITVEQVADAVRFCWRHNV